MEKQLIKEVQLLINDLTSDIIKGVKEDSLTTLDVAHLEHRLAQELVTKVTMHNAREVQHHLQRTYGV